MTDESHQPRTPRLRFPEFQDEGGWEEKKLNEIAHAVLDKGDKFETNNVLTLSSEHGIVQQGDYFGKKIAGEEVERYIKIVINDFVYNDRTTKSFAYGTIKRLSRYESGLVSPLYKCFRFIDKESSNFWEWYFNSGFHEPQLHILINEGARAGRFNISIEKFLSITVYHPNRAEQQKIADCLRSLEEVINAQCAKLDVLTSHKQGVMQQLFPAEGETVPRLRFPQFQDAGRWDLQKVSQLAKITTGNKNTQDREEDGLYPFFVRSQTHQFINTYSYDGEAVLTTGDGVGVGKNFHYINGKFDFHQRVYCIYEFNKNVNGFFFYLYFSKDFNKRVMQLSAKNSVDSVRMSMIADMPIYLPSLDEQKKIAECLGSLDVLITAQKEKLAALIDLKQGLMQQLFPMAEEGGE